MLDEWHNAYSPKFPEGLVPVSTLYAKKLHKPSVVNNLTRRSPLTYSAREINSMCLRLGTRASSEQICLCIEHVFLDGVPATTGPSGLLTTKDVYFPGTRSRPTKERHLGLRQQRVSLRVRDSSGAEARMLAGV